MYTLTVAVDIPDAPAPALSEISFNLPGDCSDGDVSTIARGIRKAFRDVYGTRVRTIGLSETGLSRNIGLEAAP